MKRSKFEFEKQKCFVGVSFQTENYRSCLNILQEVFAGDMQQRKAKAAEAMLLCVFGSRECVRD